MATPRPAKKRKTPQQPLDPIPPPTAPPLKSPPRPLASTTTDASTRVEPSAALEGLAEAIEGEFEPKEPTEEELAERRRVFDVVAEDYHDIITELPLEYARTFALVRELEDAQQGYTGLLRTTFESYLSSLRAPSTSTAPPPAPPPALHLLSQNANAAIRAGEDKLGLAISLYESVDRHIRRLDADLAKYEDSIVIGLREGTLPSHDAPAAGDKSPPGATTSLGAQLMGLHEGFEDEEEEEGAAGGVAGAGLGRKKKGKGLSAAEREKEGEWKRRREAQKLEKKKEKEREKGKGLGAAVEQAHKPIAVVPIGMPIDPNEPVYCFCQRVAFGEMIACENEDCPREWFHYDCVNLEKAPEGEWYCDPCIELLNVDPVTMKPR